MSHYVNCTFRFFLHIFGYKILIFLKNTAVVRRHLFTYTPTCCMFVYCLFSNPTSSLNYCANNLLFFLLTFAGLGVLRSAVHTHQHRLADFHIELVHTHAAGDTRLGRRHAEHAEWTWECRGYAVSELHLFSSCFFLFVLLLYVCVVAANVGGGGGKNPILMRNGRKRIKFDDERLMKCFLVLATLAKEERSNETVSIFDENRSPLS